jgi:hypothetical protein
MEKNQQKQKAKDQTKSKEEKEKERLQAQQQKPEPQGKKEQRDGKVENDRVKDARPPEATVGSLQDQLRELQKWGVLPPKMSEEMLNSSGKEAPAEYKEIISRYYKRMTEFYDESRRR